MEEVADDVDVDEDVEEVLEVVFVVGVLLLSRSDCTSERDFGHHLSLIK